MDHRGFKAAFVLGKCGQGDRGDAAEVPSAILTARRTHEDPREVMAMPLSDSDCQGGIVAVPSADVPTRGHSRILEV